MIGYWACRFLVVPSEGPTRFEQQARLPSQRLLEDPTCPLDTPEAWGVKTRLFEGPTSIGSLYAFNLLRFQGEAGEL